MRYMTRKFIEKYIEYLQKEVDNLKWQGCCDHYLEDRGFQGDTHQVATYTVEICKVCGKYIKKHSTTDQEILYKDLNDRISNEAENIILLGESGKSNDPEILFDSEDKSTYGGTR